MLSKPIRWLHLSDFHIGKDDYGERRIFKYILNNVKSKVASGAGPDIIFITGDVANRGQPAEYQQFCNSFYKPLLEIVSPECSQRIFVIPGNHDVDQSRPPSIDTQCMLQNSPTFLDPTEEGCSKRSCLFEKFAAFVQKDPTCTDSATHWLCSPQGALTRSFDINGCKVGILGINTAWLSAGKSEEERHKLSAGKGMIEIGLEELEKCDIRLVLGHHPIDWLTDDESQPIRSLFGKHNVIYLHGHKHQNQAQSEYGAGCQFLPIQTGASFWARENEILGNRLLWCELNLEAREVCLEPRKWSKVHQEWPLDSDAFPERYRRKGTDFWVFPLPSPQIADLTLGPRPSMPSVRTSLAKLPPTSPALFGREDELARLDAAWDRPKTNIVSLVAWGGVGKTALVNKWLLQMREDNYRGAEYVYGWSFYSQGAAEGKQVSADQFIASALDWFGDPDSTKGSPWDKGERLAELARKQRTLLILDGLEPLQYPPGELGGRLKDPGLQSLLRELARHNPGLCVITTRLEVDDLKGFDGTSMETIDLANLSPEAGAELLKNLGVIGTDEELKKAVKEFDGHALALTLLGSYLVVAYHGDIRHRDKVPKLMKEKKQGGHAIRVMESYERWFAGKPELDILRIMGLFDRPAPGGAIEALKAKPAIEGLTTELQKLSHADWQYAVNNLRTAKLLAPEDKNSSDTLDAHPLIREHFGEKLKNSNPSAWKEAHSRLYEYYRRSAKEYPDTIEEMIPLFAAVAHGCQAERHQEALDEVFYRRIDRGEGFVAHKLGAMGAVLATLSGFFDVPWHQPVGGLTEEFKAYVLNVAGFCLQALGRLTKAADPMRAALEAHIARKNWQMAVRNADNLSQNYLIMGDLPKALKVARQSVKLADRSGDKFSCVASKALLGDTLHQMGRLKEAKTIFRKSEDLQRELQPQYPLLYSLQGYDYCDLLLEQEKYQEVLDRTSQALAIANKNRWLLDIGLGHLYLGRAQLMQALTERTRDFGEAKTHLDKAVNGLRQAGDLDELPPCLLAHSELYRLQRKFEPAQRDLDEAMTIAVRSGIRLYEADCHLEYARLYLAMGGDYRAKAQESLAKAKAMITEMGYHRRDKEVKELEKQLMQGQ